jgi:predicted nucleic acid-binding protein
LAHLLDTNIAIHLRDLNGDVLARLADLDESPLMSILTSVELEGGVHVHPEFAKWRRDRIDAMREEFDILPFDAPCAAAYGHIVAVVGYSRRKIIDRMIAATALVHGLTLITIDGGDFRDVPGLKLDVWR